MKKSKYDLTQGSIFKNLIHLAWPIALSNILQDSFSVVDMIFVGKLGAEAISAVDMSSNLQRLISVLSLGISMGTVVLVSQSIGAQQREQGENIAMQALILSIVCPLVIACIGFPLAEIGLRLLGAEPEVVRLGVPYLRITLLGGIMMFTSMTLGSIFRAGGDSITPMVVMIVSTVLNIVLDPLLIFGIWKFPRLGVAGSAYASVIGRSAGVVIFLYLCFIGRSVISLKHVKRRVDLSAMGQILRLGIFSSMQGFLRHASRLGFIRVVAIYGTNAVAAYAICMRLRILVMHLGFGFANAVAPMVGQNIGAGQIDRAEKSANLAGGLATVMMAVLGSLLFLFPHFCIRIFTGTNGSYHYRECLPPLPISHFCIYRDFYRIWSCPQRRWGYSFPDGNDIHLSTRYWTDASDFAFLFSRTQGSLDWHRPIKCCAGRIDVAVV